MTEFGRPDHEALVRLRNEMTGASGNRVLDGAELRELGRLLYGSPELLSLYGIAATEMADSGLRVLLRTAMDCVVDGHSLAVAHAVAQLASPPLVADLFGGSGNFGHHLGRRLDAAVFAAEPDPDVHRAGRHNLGVVGSAVELRECDHRELLADLPPRSEDDVYVVDPPMGEDAAPLVSEVLADILRSRAGAPCLVVIKSPAQVAGDSLTAGASDPLRAVTPEPVLLSGARVQYHLHRLGGGL